MLNFPIFVFIFAWFILALAFIALGLGLPSTAIMATVSALGVFIVYSFLE